MLLSLGTHCFERLFARMKYTVDNPIDYDNFLDTAMLDPLALTSNGGRCADDSDRGDMSTRTLFQRKLPAHGMFQAYVFVTCKLDISVRGGMLIVYRSTRCLHVAREVYFGARRSSDQEG